MNDVPCSFKVVIPARYASSRLPGKPLLLIAGKPMILHVCDRARESGASEIIVATDDQRILEKVSEYGITSIMTRTDHANGTERIAEVCAQLKWAADDIVVNLQGDEPVVPPALLRSIAAHLATSESAGIATVATPIGDPEQLFDPNHVKVVLNRNGDALYFSRAPIPWDRNHFPAAGCSDVLHYGYLRHIGMYAYTVAFLNRYTGWSASRLEEVESLEQLRILWHGEPIAVITVNQAPEAGVDTRDDLRRIEEIFSASISQ